MFYKTREETHSHLNLFIHRPNSSTHHALSQSVYLEPKFFPPTWVINPFISRTTLLHVVRPRQISLESFEGLRKDVVQGVVRLHAVALVVATARRHSVRKDRFVQLVVEGEPAVVIVLVAIWCEQARRE